MTTNQINYWNLQETKRHNVTTENETNRHNVVTENETQRHNQVTESIDLGELNERIRHNQVSEQLGWANLSETNRHNVATEGLTGTDLNIKQDQLSETNRHNTTSEKLQQAEVNTNIYDADTRRMKTESEIALNDIERTWKGLQNSLNVEITAAKKRAVEENIKKLQEDIENARRYSTYENWKNANNTAKIVIDLVDALVPG